MDRPTLILGDCLVEMAGIPDSSVDAVVTDPPYPCIKRPYGMMTEAEWHAMMRGVVAECRRVLKPSGSAVFVLQPNYERVGRTRPWLWEFMAWTSREWNLVQEAFWWNIATIPGAGCARSIGLMRRSVKFCVWLGPETCYRDQDSVLWGESEHNVRQRLGKRVSKARLALTRRDYSPGGNGILPGRISGVAAERGGVVPFNVIPLPNNDPDHAQSGLQGHSAATPLAVMDWWVRYISPPGGVVCDPFMGSGTMGIAALERGRSFVGIEKDPAYFALAEHRIAGADRPLPLFFGGKKGGKP